MNGIMLDRSFYSIHDEIEQWCNDRFGERIEVSKETGATYNPRWQRNMMFGHQTFTFRDNEDYLLFALRWS